MPPQVSTDLSVLQGSPAASRVFDTIDSLASNLGKTVISICPFESRQGVPGVRIGIKRTSLEGGIVTESWKLSEVEWKGLLSVQNSAWIELLSEVFHRKTALTRLIATQKLTAQNYLLWHYDEDLCNRQWDHWNARLAGVLFQNRLIVQGTDRRVSRSKYFGPDPQSLCAVQLPCGHGLTIIKADLSNLTYEFCMSKTCDTCNARIMQESDIEEAKMAKKEAELEDAPKMADGWTELGWENDSRSKFAFDPNVLYMAVHGAAWSLKAPALLAPKLLCPFEMEESLTALRAMETCLSAHEGKIQRVPSDLVDELARVVEAELRKTTADPSATVVPTPPGWQEFFQLWLTRAVNFACQRGCSEAAKEHQGTHLHQSDGMVYWQDQEAAMMAMMAGLGGMGL